MNKKIYVGNLPYKTGEEELRNAFDEFGEITDVRVLKDPVTGRSRGFAFITFEDSSQARASLAKDGDSIDGRRLYVKFARDRQYVRANNDIPSETEDS